MLGVRLSDLIPVLGTVGRLVVPKSLLVSSLDTQKVSRTCLQKGMVATSFQTGKIRRCDCGICAKCAAVTNSSRLNPGITEFIALITGLQSYLGLRWMNQKLNF